MPKYLAGRAKHELKRRLCEAQNWHCCYCGIIVSNNKKDINEDFYATFEHIIPQSYLKNNYRNRWYFNNYRPKAYWNYNSLVIACFKCNNRRKATNLEDFVAGEFWKDENALFFKLYKMRNAFIRHGNLGTLKAMSAYCSC